MPETHIDSTETLNKTWIHNKLGEVGDHTEKISKIPRIYFQYHKNDYTHYQGKIKKIRRKVRRSLNHPVSIRQAMDLNEMFSAAAIAIGPSAIKSSNNKRPEMVGKRNTQLEQYVTNNEGCGHKITRICYN
ncbi:hypothetical protein BB558_004219 [Smittium angustum]|uniref:Uncharacterized protein n=1 Tax=Smittium angustum TaxID=133377 RepID=A0A2U1J3Z9_SMIAN|nr:hypothetical protein BB558_004219 [Smittium angustum]